MSRLDVPPPFLPPPPAPAKSRRLRATLACLVTLAVAAALAAYMLVNRKDAAHGAASFDFSWSMPARFGADANHDGLIDYPTSAAYLRPTSWQLDLNACGSVAARTHDPIRWSITSALLPRPIGVTAGCRLTRHLPRLGGYQVRATPAGDPGAAVTKTVRLKDVLVVSVGDSVASGEGNPDIVHAPGHALSRHTPVWEDAQCHRSELAGPAQAALRMERRDPHSSITFVSLACSGATIARGLLGPYRGIQPVVDHVARPPLAPQLDAAVRLAAGRRIDSLLVSIGANDMGFGDIVKDCLLLPNCGTTDAHLPAQPAAKQRFADGIAALPAQFQLLNGRLDEMARRAQLGGVFFTEYFDVAAADDGRTCDGVDGLSADEFAWTHAVVSPALNAALARAVSVGDADGGARAEVVGGIAHAFGRHGYCARDGWIRTLWQSLRDQHDQFGSFHPNAEGQLLGYAVSIERVVAPAEGIGGRPLPMPS